jgi:hypothetical protein
MAGETLLAAQGFGEHRLPRSAEVIIDQRPHGALPDPAVQQRPPGTPGNRSETAARSPVASAPRSRRGPRPRRGCPPPGATGAFAAVCG